MKRKKQPVLFSIYKVLIQINKTKIPTDKGHEQPFHKQEIQKANKEIKQVFKVTTLSKC